MQTVLYRLPNILSTRRRLVSNTPNPSRSIRPDRCCDTNRSPIVRHVSFKTRRQELSHDQVNTSYSEKLLNLSHLSSTAPTFVMLGRHSSCLSASCTADRRRSSPPISRAMSREVRCYHRAGFDREEGIHIKS